MLTKYCVWGTEVLKPFVVWLIYRYSNFNWNIYFNSSELTEYNYKY